MTFQRKMLRELARGRFSKISRRSYIILGIISYVLLVFCMTIMFSLDALKIINIPIMTINTLLDPIVLILIFGLSFMTLLFFFGIGFGIFELLDRRLSLLEFTFIIHRLWHGDTKFYYFEHFPLIPKTDFKNSMLRSLFGGFLVISLAIIVLENFLVIPVLNPFFWDASITTVVVLLISLPTVAMCLFISPDLTKETNLYYHDKKNRSVHNVGIWLDSSLKLFAGIDIVLVISIIITTSTVNTWWLMLLLVLLMFLISLFIIISSIYNRNYHAVLREKFKIHLEEKYKIPNRNISLTYQIYYCDSCKSIVDMLNSKQCDICGAKIRKCIICGEAFDNVKYAIYCPYCGESAHRDEFISWISMRKKCPSCKKNVNLTDLKID